MPTISGNFERGTRLAVLPPTPCDPSIGMPEGYDPSITSNAQYLFSVLSISDAVRKQYINTHSQAANEMVAYLAVNGSTPENKAFIIWSIWYLITNTAISFEELKNKLINKPFDFQSSQETYIPRDREPASYYWRPKLKKIEDFHVYLTFVPDDTDPKDIYNCYYHAFGEIPNATTEPGSPKYMTEFVLPASWIRVTGNIQVGDRIGYYMPNANGSGPAWTHAGVVIEVDSEGYATKISSKMGAYYEIIEHHPRDIPESYGSNEPSFIVNGKTEPYRIYWRKN